MRVEFLPAMHGVEGELTATDIDGDTFDLHSAAWEPFFFRRRLTAPFCYLQARDANGNVTHRVAVTVNGAGRFQFVDHSKRLVPACDGGDAAGTDSEDEEDSDSEAATKPAVNP